jgi:hypothetical protein
MKKIELDICNGLDNITFAGSNVRPDVEPGMVVALCHKNIPFKVEVITTSEDKKNCTGVVAEFKIGDLEGCNLKPGDIIEFSEENICYPTQKG